MKKLKYIVVYGIIIVLCVFAFKNLVFKDKEVTVMSNRTEEQNEQHVKDVMAKSLAVVENPVVGVGLGDDYTTVTKEAIENAGGLTKIIKKGDTVLIKPNMIRLAGPDKGMITDYRLLQVLADLAIEAGAEKVIIAEASPGGNLLKNPMTKYPEITGVEFVDMNQFNKDDCYLLKHENSLTDKELYIPKIYMDADVVISAAKLKTHFEAEVTLSLKNSFGVPPTNLVGNAFGKMTLHNIGLEKAIVDLNLIRKPDFVVIDGIIGGEGNMPTSGTPVQSNIVLAGIDPVATDTVAAQFMGFTIDEVPHIQLAGDTGLGTYDLEKIQVVGAVIEDIKMSFKRATSY